MTAKTFSVVLGEINEKYLNEAISYKAKEKRMAGSNGALLRLACAL